MDHFDQALQLLAAGQLDEARIYLEELLRQDPDNPDLLYNQGPLLRGSRPARSGASALHRCSQLAPQHSHPAWPSRTWGYPRQGRRQPAGSLLSAPLPRDRSPGPAEDLRENEIAIASEELASSIRSLIEQANARVAQSVNSEPVLLYWRIRRRIRGDFCKKDHRPDHRDRLP